MRIAFPTTEYVTESSYAGGLANYLQRIAGALRDLGHEVHVIVVSDAHPGSFESDGIRVHRLHRRHAARPLRLLKAGSAHKDAWMSRLVSQRLAGLHRVHGFDAVQYPSYRALALKRLRGVPAVVRISSHRRLWNQAGVGTGPGTDGSRTGRRAPDRVSERLELEALRRADAVYAPSRLLADAVSADAGIDISVIEPPFHVETPTEDETLVEDLSQAPYLLFFGTLSELKGVGTIARSVGDILALDPSLRFVFIGKDAGLREGPAVDVLRVAAGSNAERIIHIPPVPHEQLYPVVRGARAVVLPSLVDNLPNTCLESLGLGQVVVGTRGASFDQLITDGESGFLCNPGDPRSLLQAVSRALSLSEPERRRITAAARARIAELEPAKAAERLVEFFRAAGGAR